MNSNSQYYVPTSLQPIHSPAYRIVTEHQKRKRKQSIKSSQNMRNEALAATEFNVLTGCKVQPSKREG